MKVVILLLMLPIFAFGQFDRYGEQLSVEDVSGNTITIRGQHFGIDSGPVMEFKWEVYKDNEPYKVYRRAEDNPFLKVILLPGNYRITRYTYYYTDGVITGITESESLVLAFPIKDPIQGQDFVPSVLRQTVSATADMLPDGGEARLE